jgi:two-component system cell cycle response regulator
MIIQEVGDEIEKAFYFFSFKYFEKLSYVDDITGYFNQRALKRDLGELIEEATPFQILFMDVDNFKAVNDQHGHITGSFVLKELARVISDKSGKIGKLYRYGGDEFVVVFPNLGTKKAMALGEEIRSSVEKKKFKASSKTLSFTISIGISEYPLHAKTLEKVISMADHMMYASKKAGKNSVSHAKDFSGV